MRRLLVIAPALALFACGSDPSGTADSGTGPLDLGVQPDAGRPDLGGVSSGMVNLSGDTLNFGNVVITSTASLTLTITNPGADTVQVTVSSITGSGAERFRRSLNTPDENGRFTIERNGVVTLTVSVSPIANGALNAALAIDSCQGACPTAITLQANGVETGLDCPGTFQFGTVNPGTCANFDVACVNRGNATERITVVELEPTSSPEYTLTQPALPSDLAPGATLAMPVRFCPTGVHASAGDVRVATFRPFETERTIHLEGVGGGADVSCEPDQVSFGTVAIGASINQTITCRNRGAESATVTATLESGLSYNLISQPDDPIPANASRTIVVAAVPMSMGTLTDTLHIATNDPDAPMIDVPLSMEAIMADPCSATISTADRDFGLVGIGETRLARLTVRNTGTTTCLLRRVEVVNGPNLAFSIVASPSAGSTLQGGATIGVDLAFAPTGNAIFNGTLSVSFSNPGTTELTAVLSGSGGNSPVRVTPALLDFGATPMSCAAPQHAVVSLVRTLSGVGPVSSAAIENESTPGVFSVPAVTGLPTMLALGDAYSIEIGFQPPAAGLYSAELHIFAGGLNAPIVLEIRGEGVAAGLRTETFSFAPPKVDVLFVVDNSDSMAPGQTALADAVGALAAQLQTREADFHFGVISMDMQAANEAGRLIGTPTYIDATTPALFAELSARVQIGDGGSDQVRPFDAIQAALTAPLSTGDNAGFRRSDAALAIVFFGDDDDGSTAAPSIPQRVSELHGLAGGQALYLAAIAGPPNDACTSRHGIAEAGSRYAQLVLRAGGSVYSFCSDLNATVQKVSEEMLGAVRFPLALEPRVASIDVAVDTVSIGQGWSYDLSKHSIVFTDPSLVPTGASVEISYEPFCRSATCGNNTIEAGEECDDGDGDDTDDCSTSCLSARCGDGIAQASEGCDDGNLENSDGCVDQCVAAVCGDGYLQLGVEECDDHNTTPSDGCPANCHFYIQTGPSFFAYTPLGSGATALSFPDDDDGETAMPLPFTFSFFDLPTATISISINGVVGLGASQFALSNDNAGFPDADTPNAIIGVWWDDLFLDTAIDQAAIAYEVQGDAPNRVLVIEWRNVRRWDHSTDDHRRFTFQLRLEETTNVVRMRYDLTATTGNPPSATSASAGLEDAAGSLGFEALGCSPFCDGRPRPQSPTGFPATTEVVFTP